MSDEKDKTESDLDFEPEAVDAASPARTTISPFVGVGLLIAALLVVLLAINSRAKRNTLPAGAELSVSAARAEVEAMRSEVNRQRMSMGYRPIENGSEPIDDIAKRLTKDATTIVGLANTFQKMLAQKDGALDEKNSELLKSEQRRQSTEAENLRLQGDLRKAVAGNADGDLARADLAEVKDQRDRFAAALEAAKKDIKATAGSRSAEEFADLERRLAETQRAKEFFEKRVGELEAAAK